MTTPKRYYNRYELQWRMSIFFCASIIAGAFSGLLAFAIANMAGVGGYGAWRWIFIIEGLMTVVVGVVAKFWVADWPEKATFLTDVERRMLVRRLAADTGEARMDRLGRRATRRLLTDWKIYAGTLAYFGVVNTGYAGSVSSCSCLLNYYQPTPLFLERAMHVKRDIVYR